MVDLREFIDDLGLEEGDIVTISTNEWESYNKALSVLKHTHLATVKMQAVNYFLSDLYATWFFLQMELEKHDMQLAKDILMGMKIRERKLISTPSVLSCTFMDPRYSASLTQSERIIAIEHLTNLHAELKKLKEQAPEEGENYNAGSSMKIADLIKYRRKEAPILHISNDNIDLALQRLHLAPHIDNLECILQYWAERKKTEPALYELACTIFASCPTQANVERSFSALSFILNRYRSTMSDINLEAILLIRLNKELFDKMSGLMLNNLAP